MKKIASSLRFSLSDLGWVLRGLMKVVVGLIGLSLIGQIIDHFLGYSENRWIGFAQEIFVREFYVDAENNIPTYFSALLLLLSSALLGLIARHARRIQSEFYRHWMGLSVLLVVSR